MRESLIALLNRLLVTHSPVGDEGEMEDLARELLEPVCDEVSTDPNGNVIGKIAGHRGDDALLLMAHKDEIATIVRKIDPDGKVWLDPLGGCLPWVYGEGPFDLLGDEVVTGILSVGSRHSSHLSGTVNEARTKALTWEMCYIDCLMSPEELAARGVRIGSRGCVGRCRKTPLYKGDVVGGYSLDDKAGVAVLVEVGRQLRALGERPAVDLYLAVTGSEETGCVGGAYVGRTLPASTQIAVEIAPVAPEYPIEMSAAPVVLYKDATLQYHKGLSDRLADICDAACGSHQRMLVRSFGSDASAVAKYGFAGRAACIAFPTQNTHGYELGHLGAMENCVKVLCQYALEGDAVA